MKIHRILAPLILVAIGCVSSLEAASIKRSTRSRDFEAVQEYVNSKRTIPLEEKGYNFTLSGDIRFTWAHVVEKVNSNKLRGGNGVAKENERTGEMTITTDTVDGTDALIPFSTNEFNTELNLYVDYMCDRTWAVAWLQFDNRAGIGPSPKSCFNDPEGFRGGGSASEICLKKAYIGYNVCVDGCSRLDIELGRRPLYNVFDSRVQFQNRFDGILFRYARSLGHRGDYYTNVGFFVVDERANHYAWIKELGLINICDSGVDVKYSFIDWKSLLSHHRNRCNAKNPHGADFRVSQLTAHYNFLAPGLCCVPAKLYGAALFNHAARKWERTNHKHKDDCAWYVGCIVGEVCQEGDWSFDVNYQYVEAQAIPDSDVSGIGERANILRETFTADGRGFTNYKGWRFEFLYAIADNLSINATLEFLNEIRRTDKGKHSYTNYELSAIYAF